MFATTVFCVFVFFDFTDLIFAFVSITDISVITSDPFIIFTSNVFAILGLRALYFALAGITQYFHYIKYGLSTILVFVGLKMLMVDFFKIPVMISLFTILGILVISVVASLVFPKKEVALSKL